MQIRKTWK